MKNIQLDLNLATRIGLHESVVLTCLHEELKAGVEYAERPWVVRSFAEWHTAIPCFAAVGIRKIVKRLRDKRIIITRLVRYGEYYQLWMTIEYHRLAALGITLEGE